MDIMNIICQRRPRIRENKRLILRPFGRQEWGCLLTTAPAFTLHVREYARLVYDRRFAGAPGQLENGFYEHPANVDNPRTSIKRFRQSIHKMRDLHAAVSRLCVRSSVRVHLCAMLSTNLCVQRASARSHQCVLRCYALYAVLCSNGVSFTACRIFALRNQQAGEHIFDILPIRGTHNATSERERERESVARFSVE